MKHLFLLYVFLFSFIATAWGQTEKDSIRVLYLGNSYTYYNKLYQTVQDIAAGIARDHRMKLAYEAYTPGGCTFKRHLQNKEEVEAIRKGGWDYIVLQEQSAAPAMPTDVVLRETYPYARQLDSLIHVHNPNAKVIFYMTWGHKDGCQKKVEGYPLIDTYIGMQDRLITSYLEMTYENDALCAPVGMAWKCVRQERPYCVLYTPDASHPSALGSYLAANVIFATIYQCPYQTACTNGLEPELAEYIQQVAQQTVLNNKSLLNLK